MTNLLRKISGLINKGYNDTQAAKKLGISRTSARRYRLLAGLANNYTHFKLTKKEAMAILKKKRIRQLAKKGFNKKDICSALRINQDTLNQYMRAGIGHLCLLCWAGKTQRCRKCGRIKKHKAYHSNTKPHAFLCSKCFLSFPTYQAHSRWAYNHIPEVKQVQKIAQKKYRRNNPQKNCAQALKDKHVMKAKVLKALGGKCMWKELGLPPCTTPGAPLTLHHVNRDGKAQRLAYGSPYTSTQIYYEVLKALKYGKAKDPSGVWRSADCYSVLCRHCNIKEYKYLKESHEEDK